MNGLAKELTEKERIEALSREEKNRAAFAALQGALSLIDLTKSKNITYQTYSRDSLRTYLKNPASESNQKIFVNFRIIFIPCLMCIGKL